MYLTGDLARYLPDGRIEHLGRLDHQIKVRGFRIELGEIEATLVASPDVAAAVVVAREHAPSDTRLVAYVVPDGPMPGPSELRRRLAATLPEHMVPSIFVALDALPLSVNGKVDRNALPAPRRSFDNEPASSATPRTAVEEQMAVIWSRTLGVDRVGVHDDFFELGGHSLLATQIISRIRNSFRVQMPLHSFLETPTILGLAEKISQCPQVESEEEEMARLLQELEGLSDEEVELLLKADSENSEGTDKQDKSDS